MKVRQERGVSMSIFYDFLTCKKCIFHQFSKIDKKTTTHKNGLPIIFIPDKMYDTPVLHYVLIATFPGTCKIMWLAADGIKLLFTNFQCIQIYMFLLDYP